MPAASAKIFFLAAEKTKREKTRNEARSGWLHVSVDHIVTRMLLADGTMKVMAILWVPIITSK